MYFSIHANAEVWKYLTVDPLLIFGLLLLCPTSRMHIYSKMYTFQQKTMIHLSLTGISCPAVSNCTEF